MNGDSQRLAEADACHDAQPEHAAELLRAIDFASLGDGERPLAAFLLNHVLGEKLGDWSMATQRHSALLAAAGSSALPVLWRQAAVAATLCGDTDAAERATSQVAQLAQSSLGAAQELVLLAAASLRTPALPASKAGALVLQALAPLDAPHWQLASALDTPAAASCNNIAAALSDRPAVDLRDPALREALLRAARCSQRLWQRAGQWVQHARACYGIAVAEGAVGNANAQREAATAGLELLDANDHDGVEKVDRAFLELELAHALQRLGDAAAASGARARADALAAGFGDASLDDWYRARVARHAVLAAG